MLTTANWNIDVYDVVASVPTRNTLERFKDLYLKAKASLWP